MRSPHCSSAEPRYIIECINELLKNKANFVHSRHRSVHNSLMNLCAALAACCFFENKPEALPVRIEKSRQLVLFQANPYLDLAYIWKGVSVRCGSRWSTCLCYG